MPQRFLVTGGAGFVGSHLVAALIDGGAQVRVVDSLRTGHAAAVPAAAELMVLDLLAEGAADRALDGGPWDAVFHFASLSLVAESMREPFRYLRENVLAGTSLIESAVCHGVRHFVLSSTAALFGTPETVPITEDARIDPGSPYGESKWMLERALLWADRVHGLRSACLRYFNAAGADPAGRLGEDHDPETHLIPLVIDAALGRRPEIVVFGSDYPTADGTCVRDYVHVTDLADAHVKVLPLLRDASVRFNLGNGTGHSVLDVIRSVERVSGLRVPMRLAPRRPGDPAELVAASGCMRAATGWVPRFAELDAIVSTALRWRSDHPNGYRGSDSR